MRPSAAAAVVSNRPAPVLELLLMLLAGAFFVAALCGQLGG
jgi:hypothetical protein